MKTETQLFFFIHENKDGTASEYDAYRLWTSCIPGVDYHSDTGSNLRTHPPVQSRLVRTRKLIDTQIKIGVTALHSIIKRSGLG